MGDDVAQRNHPQASPRAYAQEAVLDRGPAGGWPSWCERQRQFPGEAR